MTDTQESDISVALKLTHYLSLGYEEGFNNIRDKSNANEINQI